MYRIEPDPSIAVQVDALPHDALLGYAEVLGVMELAPWGGESINKRNPDGEVRQLFGPDGEGMVTVLTGSPSAARRTSGGPRSSPRRARHGHGRSSR